MAWHFLWDVRLAQTSWTHLVPEIAALGEHHNMCRCDQKRLAANSQSDADLGTSIPSHCVIWSQRAMAQNGSRWTSKPFIRREVIRLVRDASARRPFVSRGRSGRGDGSKNRRPCVGRAAPNPQALTAAPSGCGWLCLNTTTRKRLRPPVLIRRQLASGCARAPLLGVAAPVCADTVTLSSSASPMVAGSICFVPTTSHCKVHCS